MRGGARRWIILTVVVLAVAALAFALLRRGRAPQLQRTLVERLEREDFLRDVSGTGVIEAALTRELTFPTQGTVAAVLVSEGDDVEDGEVLARLETATLERDLASSRSSLASARAELSRIRAQQRVDTLDVESAVASAQDALAVAEDALADASSTLATTERLFERGAASQNELDTAREAVASAERQLSQARISLQSAQTRVETSVELTAAQEASAEAQILQLETTIANLEAQLEDAELTAPFAGTVAAIGFEVGDSPPAGGVQLVDASSVSVKATFDENRAAELRQGQEAVIRPDADAREELSAEVARVSRVAVREGNTARIEAELEFTETISEAAERGLVRPGYTVTSRVVINRLDGVLLVPLEAITEADGDVFVYRVVPGEEGGAAERVEINVLDRNATVGAVEAGSLNPGDLIALINLEDLEDGTLVSFDPPGDAP